MRKLILVLAILLTFVEIVSAVNFTIDLTNEQITIIQWKWNNVDPSHTQWATAQLFMRDQVNRLISEWDGQKVQEERRDFCESFRASNSTQQQASCSAIGQPSTCNPCR